MISPEWEFEKNRATGIAIPVLRVPDAVRLVSPRVAAREVETTISRKNIRALSLWQEVRESNGARSVFGRRLPVDNRIG